MEDAVVEANFVGEAVVNGRQVAVHSAVPNDSHDVARTGHGKGIIDVRERIGRRTVIAASREGLVDKDGLRLTWAFGPGYGGSPEPEIVGPPSDAVRVAVQRRGTCCLGNNRVAAVVGVDNAVGHIGAEVQTQVVDALRRAAYARVGNRRIVHVIAAGADADVVDSRPQLAFDVGIFTEVIVVARKHLAIATKKDQWRVVNRPRRDVRVQIAGNNRCNNQSAGLRVRGDGADKFPRRAGTRGVRVQCNLDRVGGQVDRHARAADGAEIALRHHH